MNHQKHIRVEIPTRVKNIVFVRRPWLGAKAGWLPLVGIAEYTRDSSKAGTCIDV